jgi:hypothetical protein
MNKTDIKAISYRLLFLAIFTGVILYFTQTKQSVPDTNPSLSAKTFSATRHIVFVRVDSLRSFLEKIQEEQPEVFELEEDNGKLVIRSLDEKPFNAIFLDGEYLSRFDNIANTGISKLKSEAGFSLPIEKKSGISFVRMPTEIIHSIQLQKK